MAGTRKPRIQFVAPTLIATLLSAFPDHEVSVQALLRASVLFGLTERSIRVALARLSAENKVRNSSRGHYMMGQQAETVHREVADWRPAKNRTVDWEGQWIAMYGAEVSRNDRTSLSRHERALRFRGFRALLPALWVRPDNLRAHAQLENDLRQLGLHPDAHLMTISRFEKHLEKKARALWKSEKLEKTYASNLAMLEQSTARLQALPLEHALVETLTLGRTVIRDIVLDPLLPKELVDTDLRHRMMDRMQAYDDIGHRLWRAFLFD